MATTDELPSRGEAPMRRDAIRVDPDQKDEKLDPMSRIDFGKPQTIQHNLKVKSFGKVNRASMQSLSSQFGEVWLNGVLRGCPQQAVSSLPSFASANTKKELS